jgi:membrane protease YdiL (CAAX protease family)
MQHHSTTAERDPIAFANLLPFLLIAFGLAWGLFGLFALSPETIERIFGPLRASNPLFILAVYAPAIAAFVLVLGHAGIAGLGRFLTRLFLWRCSPAWYGFLFLGIPAIYVAGAALGGTLSRDALAWPDPVALLAASAFMLVLGPMEEFGWRGFALPLLQRRLSPVWAGLILGLIWGAWHLPAFYLSGTPQSGWDFMPFLVGSVAVSVIVTPLFNASRGSILLSMLFHFQLNNPLWPDAQPYDMYLFAAAAAVIVWLNRAVMFTRHGAVTAVVPPRDAMGAPRHCTAGGAQQP